MIIVLVTWMSNECFVGTLSRPRRRSSRIGMGVGGWAWTGLIYLMVGTVWGAVVNAAVNFRVS